MDETFGPNKVFKDLAWGLATRGIAVLRYEKRSHKYGAQSADDPTELTVKEEAMDDAHSAVVLLTTMPEIDPRRIFLVGHSLGAYLAPRIASGTPQIAGIILFAANARPIEDLVVEQVRYEASLAGTVTPAIQKAIDGAEASAKEMRNPDLKKGTTVHLLNASLPASYVLDLRTYHPTDVAAALSIPILVLQGERDYQVTMTDFGLWQKALAGHPKTTLKSYPGLNHFFIMGTGPASPVEYTTPGHVDKAVVDEVATWCKGQGT
jgi:dienelactone hydrolase